jgi:hypothetical protein
MADANAVEFEDFEQEALEEWLRRGLDPEEFTVAAMAMLWEQEDKVEEVMGEVGRFLRYYLMISFLRRTSISWTKKWK